MTTDPTDNSPPDRSWLTAYATTAEPTAARPLKITLAVRADDHPDALAIARLAAQNVVNLQHVVELYDDATELTPAEIGQALQSAAQLVQNARRVEENLIVAARNVGASWAEIGTALGVSRSTAKERYTRIADARLADAFVDRPRRSSDAGDQVAGDQ